MPTHWLPAATAVGGETGVLAQTYDRPRSRLSPVEAWPDALRAAVSLCFSTRSGAPHRAPGRRALLVGDCGGHGLEAAAVMTAPSEPA